MARKKKTPPKTETVPVAEPAVSVAAEQPAAEDARRPPRAYMLPAAIALAIAVVGIAIVSLDGVRSRYFSKDTASRTPAMIASYVGGNACAECHASEQA